MSKVIGIGEYKDKKRKENIEKQILDRVNQIEEDLGLEDPLTVLTDDCVINIANNLIDVRDGINDVLDLLGVSESEDVPWNE